MAKWPAYGESAVALKYCHNVEMTTSNTTLWQSGLVRVSAVEKKEGAISLGNSNELCISLQR